MRAFDEFRIQVDMTDVQPIDPEDLIALQRADRDRSIPRAVLARAVRRLGRRVATLENENAALRRALRGKAA